MNLAMQLKVVIRRVPNKIMCERLGAGNPNWDLSISSLYGLKSSDPLPTGIEFFWHHVNIKLGFQYDHEVSSHFCLISLSLCVLLLRFQGYDWCDEQSPVYMNLGWGVVMELYFNKIVIDIKNVFYLPVIQTLRQICADSSYLMKIFL